MTGEAPLRLLVLGDRADAAAISRTLAEAGVATRCDQAATLDAIGDERYDAALIDHGDPAAATAMVAALRDRAPALAVAVVSAAAAGALGALGADDTIAPDDPALAARLHALLGRGRACAAAVAAVRDDVLDIVAHDLRSPLNAISLACEALSEDATPEQRAKYVATIRRAGGRADKLLRDLLDASRLDSGAMSIDRRPIAVRALLDEARAHHDAAARERRVELGVEHDPEATTVLADRDRVTQALGNLLANAFRFAPGQPVALASRADGDWIAIEVRDHGPGFGDELLPGVFGQFWQARRSRRTRVGLGLSIVRGIVLAHGGTISAENAADGGARVTFRLRRG